MLGYTYPDLDRITEWVEKVWDPSVIEKESFQIIPSVVGQVPIMN